jgi:WhiB family redox-sensing transcriptional regulator
MALSELSPPFRTFSPMETDTTWMSAGNCHNQPPSTFFPSDGVGVEVAKKVCAGCPVLGRCLDYALENRIEHGVWGGASERQRRRLLKARRIPVSAVASYS